MSTDAPDFKAITQRQQGVWSTGDFGRFGAHLVLHGELLAESVDVHPGERVLDVGGGSGTRRSPRPVASRTSRARTSSPSCSSRREAVPRPKGCRS